MTTETKRRSMTISSIPMHLASNGGGGGRMSAAERRANHNATERARRENLNVRFMDLARALPSLADQRKPSKNLIVQKALDFVHQAKRRLELRQRTIADLFVENNLLREEVDRVRSQAGIPALPQRELRDMPAYMQMEHQYAASAVARQRLASPGFRPATPDPSPLASPDLHRLSESIQSSSSAAPIPLNSSSAAFMSHHHRNQQQIASDPHSCPSHFQNAFLSMDRFQQALPINVDLLRSNAGSVSDAQSVYEDFSVDDGLEDDAKRAFDFTDDAQFFGDFSSSSVAYPSDLLSSATTMFGKATLESSFLSMTADNDNESDIVPFPEAPWDEDKMLQDLTQLE